MAYALPTRGAGTGTGALVRRGAIRGSGVAGSLVAAFAPVELDDEVVDVAQVLAPDVEEDKVKTFAAATGSSYSMEAHSG